MNTISHKKLITIIIWENLDSKHIINCWEYNRHKTIDTSYHQKKEEVNDHIYLERCRTQSFKKVVSVDENKCETTCSNTLMSMCVMCKSLSPKNGVQFIFLY